MEWLTTNWTWLLLIVGVPAFFLLMRGQHRGGMGCGGGRHEHGGTNQPMGNNPRNPSTESGSQAGAPRASSVPQIGVGARGMSADQGAAGAPAEHAGHGTAQSSEQRPRRRHGC